MAGDIIGYVNEFDIESPEFADRFFYQVVARDLTEAAIINVSQNSGLQMIAGVNLDFRPLDKRFPAAVLTQLRGGERRVLTDAGDRVEARLRIDPEEEVYLYTSGKVNQAATKLIEEIRSAASADQMKLLTRRTLDRKS